MELDEAEQFLNGATFQWGYREQAPLYSWIVKAVSVVSGLHALTLVMIKYSLLFLFYGVFYRIARSFWTPGRSLIVTASLTLFPVYPSRRGV
jgi:hypothetical protein